MIGLRNAPTCPAVFMQAVTRPACGPAMSRQTPQHAPSRKLTAAPARAISRAADDRRPRARRPGDQRQARRPASRRPRPRTGRPAGRTPGSARSVRQAADQVGHRAEDQRQAREQAAEHAVDGEAPGFSR